jgi:hypothetical protein
VYAPVSMPDDGADIWRDSDDAVLTLMIDDNVDAQMPAGYTPQESST